MTDTLNPFERSSIALSADQEQVLRIEKLQLEKDALGVRLKEQQRLSNELRVDIRREKATVEQLRDRLTSANKLLQEYQGGER